jgi:hypothetical protein
VRLVTTLLALAGIVTALDLSSTASAAQLCRQQVIADWSDNGRVDRVYPLTCYEQAIDAMPPDLRDYSDGVDKIERALSTAIRDRRGGDRPNAAQKETYQVVSAVDTSGSAGLPFPLLLLGGVGLTLLATGGVSYLLHRATLGRKDLPR